MASRLVYLVANTCVKTKTKICLFLLHYVSLQTGVANSVVVILQLFSTAKPQKS